uniref:Uncharacterized protein n=1 Tax=Theileria annulata TaxID=5874 RepID=A0A3B0NFE2_THEAN
MPDCIRRNPTLQVISMPKKDKMNMIMELVRQSNMIKPKNYKSEQNFGNQRFDRDKYNSLMKKSIYDLRLKRAQKQLKNKDPLQKLNFRQQSEEIETLIDIIKRSGNFEEKGARISMVHVPLPREFFELKPIIPLKSDRKSSKETHRASTKLVTKHPEFNRFSHKELFEQNINKQPPQSSSIEFLPYDTYLDPLPEKKNETSISKTKLKQRSRSDEWLTFSTKVVKPKLNKSALTSELLSNVDKPTSTSSKMDVSTSTNDLEEYKDSKTSLARTSTAKSDKSTQMVEQLKDEKSTHPEIIGGKSEILTLTPERELSATIKSDKEGENEVMKVKYLEPETDKTEKQPEPFKSRTLREMSTICSEYDSRNIESSQSFDMILGDNELSELNELTELQIIENSWTIIDPMIDPIGDSKRVSLMKLSHKNRASPRSDKLSGRADGQYEDISVLSSKSSRAQPRELNGSELKSERTRNIKYLDSSIQPKRTQDRKFSEKKEVYKGVGDDKEPVGSDPGHTFQNDEFGRFRTVSKEDELYNSKSEDPLEANKEAKTKKEKSETGERKRSKSKSRKKSRKILPDVKLSEYKGFYVVHTTNDWTFS